MKVTVYDNNPGKGLWQSFLKTTWKAGCWLQKVFGNVDAYYGASSWDDAILWLVSHDKLESVQYWGHGSPGAVYLNGEPLEWQSLSALKGNVTPDSVVWFRTCSTFFGDWGVHFAKTISEILGCTVAGHIYNVGLWQPGLRTHKPGAAPSWSPTDGGSLRNSKWPHFFSPWLKNTVFCLTSKIPNGW